MSLRILPPVAAALSTATVDGDGELRVSMELVAWILGIWALGLTAFVVLMARGVFAHRPDRVPGDRVLVDEGRGGDRGRRVPTQTRRRARDRHRA